MKAWYQRKRLPNRDAARIVNPPSGTEDAVPASAAATRNLAERERRLERIAMMMMMTSRDDYNEEEDDYEEEEEGGEGEWEMGGGVVWWAWRRRVLNVQRLRERRQSLHHLHCQAVTAIGHFQNTGHRR